MSAEAQPTALFDDELQGAWRVAGEIGARSREDHLHTFTSTLLGILQAPGVTCDWLRSYFQKNMVSEELLTKRIGIFSDMQEAIAPGYGKGDISSSATKILSKAQDYRNRTSRQEIGVRHLLAAYFFQPLSDHEKDMASWGLNPPDASRALTEFAITHFPQEGDAWRDCFSQLKLGPLGTAYRFSPAAQSILELARRFVDEKSEDTDPSLKTLTSSALFFAMIESARNEPDLTASMIFRFIEESGNTDKYDSELGKWKRGTAATNREPSTLVYTTGPWTQNVTGIVSKAAELARTTRLRSPDEIAVRHLLIAMLLMAPRSRLQQRLERIGIDSSAVFRDFREGISSGRLPQDRREEWQKILLGGSTRRMIATYDSDSDSGPDFLNVSDDADGFAALIASSGLTPPLSIALFGKWGSGKSFFMRMLQDRVKKFAESGEQAFCSRIAQIRFNAWHYTDQNLWASLVSHVFDELIAWLEPSRADELEEKLQQQQGLYREAKQRSDAALRAVEIAEQKLKERIELQKEAEKGLFARARDISTIIADDPTIQRGMQEVSAATGSKETVQSFEQLERQVESLSSISGRVKRLYATNSAVLFLTAFLVPIVSPVCIWYALVWLHTRGYLQDIHSLAASVTSAVSATCIVMGIVAMKADGLVKKAERGLGKIKDAQSQRIFIATAEQQGELTRLKQSEQQTRIELLQVQERVAQLKQDQDESRPGKRMQAFIREKSSSGDYGKHLGVISLIRRDFQTLSDLLLAKGAGAPLQRIVLYVDDLDRCPPDRVVEVLEAIHLLLAYPLFTVVVGVDSRWIAHSLSVKYPGLLCAKENHGKHTAGEAASPNDYLEKIFQIPFWLRPLNDGVSRKLIRGLVPEKAVVKFEPDDQSSRGLQNQRSSDGESPAPAGSRAGGGIAITIAPGTENEHQSPSPERPPEYTAESLRIEPFELDFMSSIAGYVGDSPRRVKRFLNTYRILKASLPPTEAAAFVGSSSTPGEFRAAQVALAIHSSNSDLAASISDQIRESLYSHSISELLQSLGTPSTVDEKRAAGLLKRYLDACGDDLRPLRKWNEVLARYSFQPPWTT